MNIFLYFILNFYLLLATNKIADQLKKLFQYWGILLNLMRYVQHLYTRKSHTMIEKIIMISNFKNRKQKFTSLYSKKLMHKMHMLLR